MQFDFLTKLTGWMQDDKPVRQIPTPTISRPQDEALTARARDLLRDLGCKALASRIRVRWNARMRTTAGLANYAHSLITLNPKLAQFGETEIDKTLRHEL